MINARVEVTRLKRIVDQQTHTARAQTFREQSLDFAARCDGPASVALYQCRRSFAEKYDVPVEQVRANFSANKHLNLIHLIFQA